MRTALPLRRTSGWLLLFVGSLLTTLACASTPRTTLLKLEHQKQGVNLCVPTSASMILAYCGDHRKPAELKALATPDGSSFAGTFFKDMVRGVAKLGYRWDEECFSPDELGFETGLPKLKGSVRDGRPVMVGIFDPPIGHTVVLVGFDEAHRNLTFVDPNQPSPGLRSMTEPEFQNLWHENIVDQRCVVFTHPRT